MEHSMTSSKPYLIRAIYEWILDNNCTPYIAIDTTVPNTDVPGHYVEEDNNIVLDVSPTATQHLLINNEAITCKARFDSESLNIYIPIGAVIAIYTAENNQGMGFPKEEFPPDSDQPPSPSEPSAKKFQLKVVTGGKDQDSA